QSGGLERVSVWCSVGCGRARLLPSRLREGEAPAEPSSLGSAGGSPPPHPTPPLKKPLNEVFFFTKSFVVFLWVGVRCSPQRVRARGASFHPPQANLVSCPQEGGSPMLIAYVSDERYVALADVLLEFEGQAGSIEARSRASGAVHAELPPGDYTVT